LIFSDRRFPVENSRGQKVTRHKFPEHTKLWADRIMGKR